MAKACCGGCEADARGAACDDAFLSVAGINVGWMRDGKGMKTHIAGEEGRHVCSDGDGNGDSDSIKNNNKATVVISQLDRLVTVGDSG